MGFGRLCFTGEVIQKCKSLTFSSFKRIAGKWTSWILSKLFQYYLCKHGNILKQISQWRTQIKPHFLLLSNLSVFCTFFATTQHTFFSTSSIWVLIFLHFLPDLTRMLLVTIIRSSLWWAMLYGHSHGLGGYIHSPVTSLGLPALVKRDTAQLRLKDIYWHRAVSIWHQAVSFTGALSLPLLP